MGPVLVTVVAPRTAKASSVPSETGACAAWALLASASVTITVRARTPILRDVPVERERVAAEERSLRSPRPTCIVAA